MKRLLIGLLFVSAAAWAGTATDFLRAVSFDDVRTLQRMAAAHADLNVVDATRGENGLIHAIRDDAMRSFHFLLEQPTVKVDLPARNGDTALMLAAYKGNLEAVQDLIAHGATINKPGFTPLHYAAAAGELGIARVLLDHQADINAPSPSGITPLMIAAREGKDRMVALLIERGAKLKLVNNEQLTAEQIARRADHTKIADRIAAAAR